MNDSLSLTFDGLTETQQLRLSELLNQYLEALEEGRPLDPQQFIAAHADLAEPLTAYLESLEFLQDAAAGFRAADDPWIEGGFSNSASSPSVASSENGAAPRKQIGDFEIVREVGRGGMGVVYEARQLSLDRRVALKMLPFAALLDAKQIARFRNEAQAAAQLHHPHITPVYFVGVERGVHFYAMQFIDGQPLDGVIEDLRQAAARASISHRENGQKYETPTSLAAKYFNHPSDYFRTVAMLGAQAAAAIHAAHELGVVHRDIKPSNLLLDHDGKLWVTDFGLARCRDSARLTKTGDFVGTMRYMSPEQTRGKSHNVDHRTDVFSLGVTLYELLALRHPIRAAEPAAIVRQLESEQPYRLRMWSPQIPSDLENIVHKAMAKSRDERYPTAREMAEDLQRFLKGQPIVAKRPTAATRLKKWVCRHKLTAAFTTSLAISVMALLCVAGQLTRQILIAERALNAAEENHQQYRAQLALSSHHLAMLQDQQGDWKNAEESFQKAVTLQKETVQEEPTKRQALAQLATTTSNLSFFYARRRPALAAESFRRTVALQHQLVDTYPDHPQYANDLALTYSNWGSFYARSRQGQRAVLCYQQSITLLKQLDKATEGIACRRDLAIAYNNLGMALDALGQSQETEYSFREALAALSSCVETSDPEPRDLSRLAGIHNNLGMVQEQQHRLSEAAASYARAIKHQTAAIEREPKDARLHDLLHTHRENHTRVLKTIG